jgi:hypothetical protein
VDEHGKVDDEVSIISSEVRELPTGIVLPSNSLSKTAGMMRKDTRPPLAIWLAKAGMQSRGHLSEKDVSD